MAILQSYVFIRLRVMYTFIYIHTRVICIFICMIKACGLDFVIYLCPLGIPLGHVKCC